LDPDVATGILRLAAFLRSLDERFNSALGVPKELDPNKKFDKLETLTSIATSGVAQCFFDSEKERVLYRTISSLRLISSDGFGLSFRIGNPTAFHKITAQFPQTDTNTKMDVLEIESTAEQLLPLGINQSPAASSGQVQYSFGDFISAVAHGCQLTMTQLHELDEQCGSTIREDAASLKLMDIARRVSK